MGLIEGELDAFVGQERLAWRPLAEMEQFIVVGPGHPWAGRASVRLEELSGQPMILRPPGSQTRAWLDGALRERGVAPVVATEFDNLEAMKRSAAQGTCLTVLPEYVVRGETAAGQLAAIPVEGRPLLRTLKLVWAEETPFGPVAVAFLEELSREFAALRPVIST
jgi:DNA-binding transcriptional LysR family regulator